MSPISIESARRGKGRVCVSRGTLRIGIALLIDII